MPDGHVLLLLKLPCDPSGALLETLAGIVVGDVHTLPARAASSNRAVTDEVNQTLQLVRFVTPAGLLQVGQVID